MIADLINYFVDNRSYLLLKVWQHFYLFLASWLLALIIGIALSIIASRPKNAQLGRAILLVTGAGQAIPSLAVIALAFLILGIGWKPVLFALVLYSLVPVVFNSTSGLLSVDKAVIEAAKGMGMNKNQILWRLEIPLSIRAIAAGARSAATINIGSVAIAAAIGAGSLGEVIYTGLRLLKVSTILAGAIPVTIMAILIDLILGWLERRLTSSSLLETV